MTKIRIGFYCNWRWIKKPNREKRLGNTTGALSNLNLKAHISGTMNIAYQVTLIKAERLTMN